MSSIPFVTLDAPRYGAAVRVSPLVRRVIAENPSKFTYFGTGTYIIGSGDVAVIDPGPILDGHRDALAAALEGERVTAILITHCHSDHSPLAAWLRESSGAPTIAFGPHAIIASDDDDEGEGAELEPGMTLEETTDTGFVPDVRVADGDIAAAGTGWTMRAVHTPGHTSNHMCYALEEERSLFTGDHVMGWSTTVVSPPDGDMRDYIDSLRKVIARNDASLWPTHGAPVTDPQPFLAAFLEHRLEREAQVLAAVRSGQSAIPGMVEQMYADVRPELHKAAGRSVLSHLIKLVDDREITVEGHGKSARYLPT
ncbi:MAG TPA: MBL fold metallo-hydrolase [Ilumatobacteraceae bacterium]|jgi:glyoxylase-like metal-dependent hydrolase (beta-lactamase superfamily II)